MAAGSMPATFFSELKGLKNDFAAKINDFYSVVYKKRIYSLVKDYPLKSLALAISIFVTSVFSWILFLSLSFIPLSGMISWPFRYSFIIFPLAYAHVLLNNSDRNEMCKNWQKEVMAVSSFLLPGNGKEDNRPWWKRLLRM